MVLIDTAGRLHTKSGLMDELSKVKRVIEKRAHVDDVLLVLDKLFGDLAELVDAKLVHRIDPALRRWRTATRPHAQQATVLR